MYDRFYYDHSTPLQGCGRSFMDFRHVHSTSVCQNSKLRNKRPSAGTVGTGTVLGTTGWFITRGAVHEVVALWSTVHSTTTCPVVCKNITPVLVHGTGLIQ